MIIPKQNPNDKTPSIFSHDGLTVTVPKEVTFNLPPGNFRGKLISVKPSIRQTASGPQEWVKLFFEVQVPALPNMICKAWRSFRVNLNEGSDLRNFLASMLGKGFFQQLSGGTLKFNDLLGTECDLTLIHQYNDDYEKPLVVVANAFPVGTLVSAASPAVTPEGVTSPGIAQLETAFTKNTEAKGKKS